MRAYGVALARRLSSWSAAEFVTLAFLALASGGIFLFIQLASEVAEGDTRALDEAILSALRQPGTVDEPIGPAWVKSMFIDITSLGGNTTVTLLTAAVAFYFLIAGNRNSALLVTLTVMGGTAVSTALKAAFARPRPEIVGHLVDVHTLSFPSGHAMLSAVTYLTLGALLARTQKSAALRAYFISLAIILTLMIGASRVYLGVHYPTDVLAGWCAGAAWAMLCWAIALWLARRREARSRQADAAGEAAGRYGR
jgi:undecaprenyl-diphosphatase